MIASLDLNISIKLLINIQLIHFIVSPKQYPITVTWVSVFLQSVLASVLVKFVCGEKSDRAFPVELEVV